MNSSDEFWEFGGVSLHQFGWSVTTLGTRYGVAPLRGENAQVAYVPGEVWVPKIPGPRTIGLSMWVIGADPGTGAAVDDPRLRWNDSWAYLRQVFWNPDAESLLVRRWLRSDPSDPNAAPAIVRAEAMAQLASGEDIQPTMTGRTRATFEVPLRLAHPFFYGQQVSTTIGPGETWSVVNAGDWAAWSKWLYVDLVGPLTAPRLTNAGACYCGITGKVAAGETLTLDVRQFLALSTKSGATTNRTGEIYNSGTRPWMALRRGSNQLTLTAAGSGHAVLRFRPPYL